MSSSETAILPIAATPSWRSIATTPTCSRKTTPSALFDMVDAALGQQRRVAEGAAPMSRLESLQKATGLSCSPHGLFADRELRDRVDLLDAMRMDWMHAMLQDGTLTVEAGPLLACCERIGVTAHEIESHLKRDWQFPKASQAKSKSLYKIFSDCRRLAAEKVKCSASEMLGLYVLLRDFFESRVGNREEVKAQLQSFQACCACVDIILRAKRGAFSRWVISVPGLISSAPSTARIRRIILGSLGLSGAGAEENPLTFVRGEDVSYYASSPLASRIGQRRVFVATNGRS